MEIKVLVQTFKKNVNFQVNFVLEPVTPVFELDKIDLQRIPSVARKKTRKIFWNCESFYENCEEF